MKIGMIFPGYASQYVGMGKELYDDSRLMQEFFEEAATCLNNNVIKLCFASSEVELAKIHNAYPLIFLVSSSIAALLKEEGFEPTCVAGYQIGHYAALFAAKGISLPDGLYLLSKYALFYQEMLNEIGSNITINRIMGVPTEELEKRLQQKTFKDITIAAYRTPTEHIITGPTAAITLLNERLAADYGKVVLTDVGLGHGFQSERMNPVVERLTMYLEKLDFNNLACPLIKSSGAPLASGATVRADILEEIRCPIKWYDIIQHMAASCDMILSIGPGTEWAELIRAQFPKTRVQSINTRADIQALKVHLAEKIETEHP